MDFSIALVGFMGSGKTTTANLLAEATRMHVLSVDKEIEKVYGKSIKEIFNEKGEDFFRELEREIIKNHSIKPNYIIDTGGGAFTYEENRNILKNNGVKTIFLDIDFNLVCGRLEEERNHRPLLSQENWRDIARNLLEVRYNDYKKADFCIKIQEFDSSSDVLFKIIKVLNLCVKNA